MKKKTECLVTVFEKFGQKFGVLPDHTQKLFYGGQRVYKVTFRYFKGNFKGGLHAGDTAYEFFRMPTHSLQEVLSYMENLCHQMNRWYPNQEVYFEVDGIECYNDEILEPELRPLQDIEIENENFNKILEDTYAQETENILNNPSVLERFLSEKGALITEKRLRSVKNDEDTE